MNNPIIKAIETEEFSEEKIRTHYWKLLINNRITIESKDDIVFIRLFSSNHDDQSRVIQTTLEVIEIHDVMVKFKPLNLEVKGGWWEDIGLLKLTKEFSNGVRMTHDSHDTTYRHATFHFHDTPKTIVEKDYYKAICINNNK